MLVIGTLQAVETTEDGKPVVDMSLAETAEFAALPQDKKVKYLAASVGLMKQALGHHIYQQQSDAKKAAGG